MGVGVRERARKCSAPITSAGRWSKRHRPIRVRVVLGYLRAGRELDSAELAAQGRLGLLPVCSAVLSEEQYRPGTLRPGA
ncbi:hypothetical protein SSOG_07289 [Streptomyces himastatinicus ATCC 53653]|uniref:Uncharacterized protein n=1 Tax=Streptomyces himastatinicus ATCC 53653 TaxID=457427 RepID=D9WIS2_9ACTN|nr:hypothetical protein SSOG_07289 [Streptomyces himastatinicus ATCC 53653]